MGKRKVYGTLRQIKWTEFMLYFLYGKFSTEKFIEELKKYLFSSCYQGLQNIIMLMINWGQNLKPSTLIYWNDFSTLKELTFWSAKQIFDSKNICNMDYKTGCG